jgi:hypothetical protein
LAVKNIGEGMELKPQDVLCLFLIGADNMTKTLVAKICLLAGLTFLAGCKAAEAPNSDFNPYTLMVHLMLPEY